MVRMFVNRPNDRRIMELWWNHIAKPDVNKRADNAPVSGHGLGFTIWYAWVWWVIMYYHVGIG